MNNPIGILDSGVGGLSVWKAIEQELPHESTVYIADSANVPYGPRTPEEIYPLAKRLVEFLLSKQAKIIVVACNTITVSCLEKLRLDYPDIPIIGTVPVVKKAAEITRNNKIGILSTTRTAESDYQKSLIEKFASDCQVVNVGTDELVPLVERGEVEGIEIVEVLERVLQPFKQGQCDVLALGCTHYPFLQSEIQRVVGEQVQLLEPSGAIARHVRRILEHNQALNAESEVNHQFYTTGDSEQFGTVIHKLLGEQQDPFTISAINL